MTNDVSTEAAFLGFAASLERIRDSDERIGRLHALAQEKFRKFPHLSSISVDVGAMFVVNFGITMTFNREEA